MHSFLLLLLACGRDPTPPTPSAGPPQTVILVITCTMRADRLHVYGNEREVSPYIDALAKGGARFERTLTNVPWTKPAVATLVSGRYPRAIGIDDPGPKVNTNRGVPPDVATLAERFQAAGWATAGATANPNANEVFGFRQGFDQYHEASGLWRDEFKKVPGEDVVDAWLALTRDIQGPLYGQLVLVDTHSPLDNDPLRRARLGLPSVGGGALLDRYDAAVNALDDVFAHLDAGLAAQGRSDRLLVMVGDHGEGLDLPKHAGRAHGRWLYEPTLHIPWILHGPGVAPGTVIGGLSESVDVAPTLLELAGLPAEAPLDGDSRAAAVRGERSETGESAIYTETRYGKDDRARLTTPEWVYIHNYERTGNRRGLDELYAPDDRWQEKNLYKERKDEAAPFKAQLDALRARLDEGALVWEQEMSDEERQALEALGYIEGGDD